MFPAPAELGECEGSPASRSDGTRFSCGPPVKTQRAFHLQKNQVSRYSLVHTCKEGALGFHPSMARNTIWLWSRGEGWEIRKLNSL